ncbi:MAG: hypothetical protein HY671_04195 [Chloroflexi bacterium]|nr:hypothetical protein [Chloroflexota bacterium]
MHIDPKAGIARYGPRSYKLRKHPSRVRVGVIGTSSTIELSQEWLVKNSEGVPGDEKHPEFPGFQPDRGFFSAIALDSGWVQQITQSELEEAINRRGPRDGFELTLHLLEEKLRLLAEGDQPPDYVLVGLPDDLLSAYASVEYMDDTLGQVHRDLRRAFKAAAMRYRIPTQILRQPTMEGKDRDQPSKIAWNFFTGMYFKGGGTPWAPTGLEPGTCYVGISFYRPLGSKFSTMQTSIVQAFDEQGEGLVLRGHEFEWDPNKEGSRSPHLTEQQAGTLIEMVLERYQQEMKQTPRRVVVYKTSQFWPAERDGMRTTLRNRVGRYDLLAMEGQSTARLIPPSKYPPLRGTRFSVGDLDFLYTTGFVAELGEFHGTHVPSPVRISDHVGQDTPRQQLVRETLILTKMNWNSAHLGGLWPITIRFSRLVGDIMREMPPNLDPLPQFKFYV